MIDSKAQSAASAGAASGTPEAAQSVACFIHRDGQRKPSLTGQNRLTLTKPTRCELRTMNAEPEHVFPDLPEDARADTTFEAWWNLPGEWVEAPNHCRGGMSGVARCNPPVFFRCSVPLYLKRQVNHVFRSWRNPVAGIPTAAREAIFLERMQKLDLKVPAKAHFGLCKAGGNQYAVLATEALDGYASLETVYADGTRRALVREADPAIRSALANYLAQMHHARLQHGCLYPKHVFVRLVPESDGLAVQIALIDLEKMRQRLSSRTAGSRDLAQFLRHQEFWDQQAWEEFIRLYETALDRLS